MVPKEGSYVLFYDDQDNMWKQGTILSYTERSYSAVIELDDGVIVVMPKGTNYRILTNERK